MRPGNRVPRIPRRAAEMVPAGWRAVKSRATPHLRARIAFGLGVLILLFVGVISYRGVLLARESENRVSHTQEVLDDLRALSLAIVTIEASSRGFVLTGGDPFLASYGPAIASVGMHQASLRILVQDNPGQLRRLQLVEALTAQKIARSQGVIALRRSGGFNAALAAIETGIGTRISSDFQALIMQMQGVERGLLVQRSADVARRLWQSKAIALLGVSLALLIIAAAAWSVRYSGNRRVTAEGAQRESERRFSEMLKHVQLAAVMLDDKARITYCNEHLLRLTGWTAEEIVGRDWLELFIPASRGNRQDAFARLLANLPEAWHGDHEILTRSGKRRLMRWNNSLLRAAGGAVIGTASIGEDITDSKIAQDRIVHLNRVYATLGRINALIVRVRDRDELFRESCQIAIDAGGFLAAMISVVGPPSSKILPVASAGRDEALVAAIKRLLSSADEAPTTMVAHAIGGKVALVSNDSQNDPRVLIGKQYAEAGVHSIAVLPLIVAGEAKGALALYASEKDFFHQEEMNLLAE
ncbi:MAG TPA: CHASE3 domain-containing protein, partial [Burkholderiales bacterium]|nr:CHASE3 domain-containing protein [Burkholderiales bacterium]